MCAFVLFPQHPVLGRLHTISDQNWMMVGLGNEALCALIYYLLVGLECARDIIDLLDFWPLRVWTETAILSLLLK